MCCYFESFNFDVPDIKLFDDRVDPFEYHILEDLKIGSKQVSWSHTTTPTLFLVHS